MNSSELADQLGLGSKCYVIGFSMGASYLCCLKYIPQSWAALLAPVINYWWPGFPSNLSTEAYYQQLPNDQWALRVSHYAPWLTYWWNTQKWFPGSSAITHSADIFYNWNLLALSSYFVLSSSGTNRQQGEYESVHRDLIIGFGTWEFSPMDLENPFPNNEGSVHLWHGDEDLLVLVSLQRYIAQQLPWIQYHELRGAGHIIPHAPWMSDNIVKALLVGENRLHLCGFACTPLMVITNIDTANFSMD
ncbi:germin-like protein subfamily 3 member 2-like [Hibiscus syriacus]|uniref:Germin-like protein subfamily 3 member 2-like n=1 Tax=Hibiscus syriacus TaxID=106335 RepID=A0A6A3BVN5_HIBSY|nr:germin-like protein subfamily 3 member 2-like [Hibiscus syriacus]